MSKRLRAVLEHAADRDFDLLPTESRLRAVLAKYGLTEDAYVELITLQAGGCAICGRKSGGGKSQFQKYLSVDHDHATGKVRGLLCQLCNSGLGSFKDDTEVMRLAIAYLERNTTR